MHLYTSIETTKAVVYLGNVIKAAAVQCAVLWAVLILSQVHMSKVQPVDCCVKNHSVLSQGELVYHLYSCVSLPLLKGKSVNICYELE